ncbi:hypothetical protein LIER_01696 [Lithospermum erythrorhizon]|uniref:WAT1-related protein n=1 Tax=Lithospermum erythrorhizon TaxID=34254 RepID=A0AAV3NRE6_LITER
MDAKKFMQDAQVGMGMLMVQIIAAGLQILSKVILKEGMFIFAFIAYRLLVGAIVVAPFAIFRERLSEVKFSWSAFFWIFLVALIGITMAMGFFYCGLRDTSATYATNFLNLIPIVTFVLSTILRIEKLRLHRKAGKIKVCGAVLCLGGALIITVYKGRVVNPSRNYDNNNTINVVSQIKTDWTRGTIFLVCSCLSYGLWFIIQVKAFKVFPHRFWATVLTCVFASMQSAVIGLCIDRSKSTWKLGWNLQLITIIYSGALASGATFCIISWAIAKHGPTYPSMFNPISLILVAIVEGVFLGEDITIGSLIGMTIIVVGLYSFLFGKNMELKNGQPAKGKMVDEIPTVLPESGGVQLNELTAVVTPALDDDFASNSHNNLRH